MSKVEEKRERDLMRWYDNIKDKNLATLWFCLWFCYLILCHLIDFIMLHFKEKTWQTETLHDSIMKYNFIYIFII